MGNFVAFWDFPSQLSSSDTKSTFRTKTEVDGEEVNNRLKLFYWHFVQGNRLFLADISIVDRDLFLDMLTFSWLKAIISLYNDSGTIECSCGMETEKSRMLLEASAWTENSSILILSWYDIYKLRNTVNFFSC